MYLIKLIVSLLKNLMTRIILVAACTGLCCSLFAQKDQYLFESIDTRHGLSNNEIRSIFKDETGFMWFGTMSGLNRYDGYNFKVFRHKTGDSTSINDNYVIQLAKGPGRSLFAYTPNGWNIYDPQTEKFRPHIQSYLKSIGIPDDNFTRLTTDNKDNFWFVFPRKGIYKYNAVDHTTAFYSKDDPNYPLYSNNVFLVAIDHAGFTWISYTEGIIEKRNSIDNRLLQRSSALQQYSGNQRIGYRMFVDADNDIWIYSTGEIKGIYYYNVSANQLLPIRTDSKTVHLNNDLVRGVTQDDNGSIWVATDHGGVNLINKKDFSVAYLESNENDSKSISQNSINTIYKDRDGIVWLGTFKKGINYFHGNNLKFPLYQHRSSNGSSLLYNDVNRFVEDKKGNLWIGTNGGGLIYFDRAAGRYTQYVHDAAGANSLSNNVIVSLFIDKEEKLWIGSYYGGLDCFDGKKFVNYKHSDKDPFSLADDRVWEIFEDSENKLWIGTFSEGLQLFDKAKKKFVRYRPPVVHSGYISSLMEDKEGNIWNGTAGGIDILDKSTGLFRHYEHIDNDNSSLSHNNVIYILEDSRGLVWIGTRDGLNVFDPAKKNFKTFRTENGLADNTVLTILEDHNHTLWVSTPNGLSNLSITQAVDKEIAITCKNYDETDGLQGRQFNENAAFRTRNGEMVFGGTNGFNIFLPSKIAANKTVPHLILTDLQIFNSSVKIGDKYNGRVILPESITEAKEITLQYNQNVFTIEFAALEFLNPDKTTYAYKLEGFNDAWLTANSKSKKATFTNLNPGTYKLLVTASNDDGVWSEQPLSIKIRVLPPFWKTPVAFILYVLAIIGLLIWGRHLVLRRAKLNFEIEKERQRANRLHELDMMKIKFFTNVSHEFRTPLSLILNPVEKLLKYNSQPAEKKHFQLIHRNARRLLNLVNQLLDFRKLEEHELKLVKTQGDIIQFIKEIAYSFSDIADNKKIVFSFHASHELVFTVFDHDKLERILFNLLSNAFKFTPAGGSVSVLVQLTNLHGERHLELQVSDTGIGIDKDKQDKIFERFFQSDIPGLMLNQGSGIGLAITKEFIKLHNGTITVESEIGKGSSFIVAIPIPPVEEDKMETGLNKPEIISKPDTEDPVTASAQPGIAGNKNKKKKSILLVEDNDDFRFYIKDNLKAHYHIIEAENGKTGWQKALSEHPDLIVCDISMPEMNGIELCKKIKEDKRTSLIPVILLTALIGDDQQLAGLQNGANDYITKPFNFEILFSKVQNLLSQQAIFKKTYQKQVQVQTSEVEVESGDKKFVQQALAIIEKNISNPDFSVEELSHEMFMSRVALYKKMFSLTGKTPIEFVRTVRMQRALLLLDKADLTVAEVAYEVGFNNPRYFSKHFKEEYNILPSAYLEERNKAKQQGT